MIFPIIVPIQKVMTIKSNAFHTLNGIITILD